MNDTTKALFRYVKREDYEATLEALREHAFGALYHPDMRFMDVFSILLRTYKEALMEPRFALGNCDSAFDELLLAPIDGSHSVKFMGPADLNDKYSVEQFYGSMIRKMLCDLRLARVDWCATEIWPAESKPATLHQPRLAL